MYSRVSNSNPRSKETNIRMKHELKTGMFKPSDLSKYATEDFKKLLVLIKAGIPLEEKVIGNVYCPLVIEDKKLVLSINSFLFYPHQIKTIQSYGYTHRQFCIATADEILKYIYSVEPTGQEIHCKYKLLGGLVKAKKEKKNLNFRYRRVINDDIVVDFYIVDRRKLCVDITKVDNIEKKEELERLGFLYRMYRPNDWKRALRMIKHGN